MIRVCDKHGEYECKETELFGKTILSGCPECIEENDKLFFQNKINLEADAMDKKISDAMIPLRFKDVTIDNYNCDTVSQNEACKKCKTYIKNLDTIFKTGESLFLCGSYGTGKTHLAIAILKEALETSTGLYTKTMTMLRDIRSSYSNNSKFTEQQIINKYVNTNILVLDEVGVQYGTDNEKLLIFDVINGRYENYRPTIIISNLSAGEMKEYLGERVFDRLKCKTDGLVIMDWESYRNKD